jgi:4-hydroxybenzoate polyprenyltransferase
MGRGCLFLVLLGLLGLVISAYVDPEFRWLVPVGIVMALIIARLKS